MLGNLAATATSGAWLVGAEASTETLRQMRVAGQRRGEAQQPVYPIGGELVEGVEHRDSVLSR